MDRVENIRNRVFYDGLGLGRNFEYSLHTVNTSNYRVTGFNQIRDIINTGFVRCKEGRLKGGHSNELFWSNGGDKLFYYDKRPVLEVSADKLKDNQVGALFIDDLKSIWIFNEEENCYKDEINKIKIMYLENKKEEVLESEIKL